MVRVQGIEVYFSEVLTASSHQQTQAARCYYESFPDTSSVQTNRVCKNRRVCSELWTATGNFIVRITRVQ